MRMGTIILVNSLTALRIVLTVFYVDCLLNFGQNIFLATGLYVAICATDLLDGRLARKYNACTKLGELLDVFADLCFILLACVVLSMYQLLPYWMVGVITLKFLEFCCTSALAKRAGNSRMFVSDRLGRMVVGSFYALPFFVPALGQVISPDILRVCINVIGLLIALCAAISSYNRIWSLKRILGMQGTRLISNWFSADIRRFPSCKRRTQAAVNMLQ